MRALAKMLELFYMYFEKQLKEEYLDFQFFQINTTKSKNSNKMITS